MISELLGAIKDAEERAAKIVQDARTKAAKIESDATATIEKIKTETEATVIKETKKHAKQESDEQTENPTIHVSKEQLDMAKKLITDEFHKRFK